MSVTLLCVRFAHVMHLSETRLAHRVSVSGSGVQSNLRYQCFICQEETSAENLVPKCGVFCSRALLQLHHEGPRKEGRHSHYDVHRLHVGGESSGYLMRRPQRPRTLPCQGLDRRRRREGCVHKFITQSFLLISYIRAGG